jgi:nucleoid-associated protein YgaU
MSKEATKTEMENETATEKVKKPRNPIARETRIGITVILLLLAAFGALLTRRLMRPAEDQPATTAENGSETDGSASKQDPAEKDASLQMPAWHKATVLSPAAPNRAAKRPADDFGPWAAAGDGDKKSEAPPPPHHRPVSLMPDPVAADPLPAGADERSAMAATLQPAAPQPAASAAPLWQTNQSEPPPSKAPDAAPATPLPEKDASDPPPDRMEKAPATSPVPSSQGVNNMQVVTVAPAAYQQPPRAVYSAPAAPLASAPTETVRPDGTYEVRPNDTFWTISERLYGTGAYFKALAQHNRGKVAQADKLNVGDVIAAPAAAELEKRYPNLCPKASHRDAVRARTMTVSTSSAPAGGRTYAVQEGDTLYDIARYELGKAARWVEIYELNRNTLGKDFDYLTPGMQLALPNKDRAEPADKLTRRPGNVYER